MWASLSSLTMMFRYTLEESATLQDGTRRAYNEVMAPHHAWMVRQAVGAGIYLMQSKDVFVGQLGGDGKFTPEQVIQDLKDLVSILNAIYVKTWSLFEDHKLTDLP